MSRVVQPQDDPAGGVFVGPEAPWYELVSEAQLIAILDHIRGSIAAGDSFEGSIEYLMPSTIGHEIADQEEYAVRAFFRIGNSMGQGGAVTYPHPNAIKEAQDGRY